jgi:hypothetical protein
MVIIVDMILRDVSSVARSAYAIGSGIEMMKFVDWLNICLVLWVMIYAPSGAAYNAGCGLASVSISIPKTQNPKSKSHID